LAPSVSIREVRKFITIRLELTSSKKIAVTAADTKIKLDVTKHGRK